MAQDTLPPVILHKSNAEIFKSGIKNLLSWRGYS